jgi:general stress protein 26
VIVEELLAQRLIGCLVTENGDRSPHLTAVWYLHEDGVVYVGTSGRSRKARNAEARPRGGFMVDSRGGGPMRGAATAGQLELLRDDEARAVNERIWSRYLTPAGLADPAVAGALAASDDVTICLRAGRWSSWDTSADFAGALERPGIQLPLDG